MGARKAAALCWAVAVALSALWLWAALGRVKLETSIFALVPTPEPGPAEKAAEAAVRLQVERRFLLLVGHGEEARAVQVAEGLAESLRKVTGVAGVVCAVNADQAAGALDFYRARRWSLLDAGDEQELFSKTQGLAAAASSVLALPPGFSGSLGFGTDPFGHFGRWLASGLERAGKLQVRDGHLVVDTPEASWVAVLGERDNAELGFGGIQTMHDGFEAARAQALSQGCQVLRAGFVFHEQKAAKEAQSEMSSIGSLSLVLLVLLLALAFARPQPMLLALLPVLVGCTAATAALLAIYPKVHLAAVVFGSTIVGVAEDFGMHYLCGIYDPGPWRPWERLKKVQRGIALALATSVLGYAALFFLPLPGLHQIGLFSAVGLGAAFLTVWLWFPWLAGGMGGSYAGRVRIARRVEAAWPKVDHSRAVRWGLGGLAALALFGCLRLKADDDLRLLYARDAGLEAEQAEASSLAGLPTASGYFVVQAEAEQALLEREEAALAKLKEAGLDGRRWQALSHWVPSQRRQSQVRSLWARALQGEPGLVLERDLGAAGLAKGLAAQARSIPAPLDPQLWLAQPVSQPYRHLWLGQAGTAWASLILPSGALTPEELKMGVLALEGVPGLRWVDKAAQTRAALGTLRGHLSLVLLVGLGVVALVLWRSFGKRAWRAGAPTLLGLACGLASLSLLGLPLNLFGLLALVLVLGLGIDYGIYIQEAGAQPVSAFVAVNLAAMTNIAAFGLLAFSGTPALKAFGLVLAVGTGVAWLSAPCFSSAARETP